MKTHILIDPSFQETFCVIIENSKARTSHKRYFLLTAETKSCNGMSYGKNFFD